MQANYHVYIVSDATGLSAETTALAAMAQFQLQPGQARYHKFPGITSPDELAPIVLQARDREGVIVYTLGDAEWANRLGELARQHDVPALNLLGPAVTLFARHFGLEPRLKNVKQHRFTEDYFRRIEAIEFAVSHDDGRMQSRLRTADIVLLGVSRSSKTPLSIYLANLGYRVANVPLVLGVPAPKALSEIPRYRIFGLTIDLDALLKIRRDRLRTLGTATQGEYADPKLVAAEINYAEELMEKLRVPVLNVTGRAIEDTANEIIRLLERRMARYGSGNG